MHLNTTVHTHEEVRGLVSFRLLKISASHFAYSTNQVCMGLPILYQEKTLRSQRSVRSVFKENEQGTEYLSGNMDFTRGAHSLIYQGYKYKINRRGCDERMFWRCANRQ